MKRIANLKNILALMTLVLLSSFTYNGSTSVDLKAYDPVGIWDYTVTTDEGDLTGIMTISMKEEKLHISIQTDTYGTLILKDIELKEAVLTATVELEGDVIDFEFEFEENSMEGYVGTPDGTLSIEAKRRKK